MDDWKVVIAVSVGMVLFVLALFGGIGFVARHANEKRIKQLELQLQAYQQEYILRKLRLPEMSDKRDKAEAKKCREEYQKEVE